MSQYSNELIMGVELPMPEELGCPEMDSGWGAETGAELAADSAVIKAADDIVAWDDSDLRKAFGPETPLVRSAIAMASSSSPTEEAGVVPGGMA